MRALVLHRDPDHRVVIDTVSESDLPDGEVLIDVSHSSLNYKDGLAVTNRGKIVRGAFPFVPGIDLAGTVAESQSADWTPGDRVILTGWGTGENRWGGYAERARASAAHLVAMPPNLTPEAAMWMGTAGFTAALSVLALRDGEVTPDNGPIAVTGASGGVGSVSVALLAADGYEVHAVTGTESAHGYLQSLGAAEVLGREAMASPPENPMGRATWAGAIDSVGGTTLQTLLATAKRHACIAACGLAGGAALTTTVFPFILRGVALQGIDSNTATPEARASAWNLLATAIASGAMDGVEKTVIGLDDVPMWAEKIVAGETLGRVVVAL